MKQRKMFTNSSDSKSSPLYDSMDFGGEASHPPRYYERNDNINSQLASNYYQIKELIKERRALLEKKTEIMLKKNKEKIQSIYHSKEQDLINQARMLNDQSLINLIEHVESLNGSKNLFQRINGIKDMTAFEATQKNGGKLFWDAHKQFQREMKRRSELFYMQEKQLKVINEKQRTIFNEIEKLESEMISQLTKARQSSDHLKKAELFNDEIEKRKNYLREMKAEKDKLKAVIQNTIDSILEFNMKHEGIFKKKLEQLREMYGGAENMTEFDSFLNSLETVVAKKQMGNRGEQQLNVNQLKKLSVDYNLLIEQLQKFKEEEDSIFAQIAEEMKENVKFSLLEKAFLSDISQKINQADVLKKCRGYRKLLFDLSQDRPRLQSTMKQVAQMNSKLYPIKKAYATENIRRQELKKELKRLSASYLEVENRTKKQRNYLLEMELLNRRRQAIQYELNECAEKGNINDYKIKRKDLEQINRQIEQQRDMTSTEETKRMQEQIFVNMQRLYEQYDDLIDELELHDQSSNIGSYLTKLEKRISLI